MIVKNEPVPIIIQDPDDFPCGMHNKTALTNPKLLAYCIERDCDDCVQNCSSNQYYINKIWGLNHDI